MNPQRDVVRRSAEKKRVESSPWPSEDLSWSPTSIEHPWLMNSTLSRTMAEAWAELRWVEDEEDVDHPRGALSGP